MFLKIIEQNKLQKKLKFQGADLFFKWVSGRNCPLDNMVVTPRMCKEASAALGLSYCGAVKDSYFPAGCYHDNSKSYFNEYVDPSITSPAFFGNKGGICYKGKFWYCHRKENICINILAE